MLKLLTKEIKIKLKKRKYLGKGYLHFFRNKKTGEILVQETTKEHYEKMGKKIGSQYNPVKTGYNWTHSSGETIKVDTPTTLLGENEYVEFEGKYFVKAGKLEQGVPLNRITNDEIIINEEEEI